MNVRRDTKYHGLDVSRVEFKIGSVMQKYGLVPQLRDPEYEKILGHNVLPLPWHKFNREWQSTLFSL